MKKRYLSTSYQNRKRQIKTHQKFGILEKIMKEYGEIDLSELIDELKQHRIKNPEYIINSAKEDGYIFLDKDGYFKIN